MCKWQMTGSEKAKFRVRSKGERTGHAKMALAVYLTLCACRSLHGDVVVRSVVQYDR